MSDIVYEFESWQRFRDWKIFYDEEDKEARDADFLRLKAQLCLEERKFFEAYRYYWRVNDEIGKRAVFDALLKETGSLYNLLLAECIALENDSYPLDGIFEGYMLQPNLLYNAMRLAKKEKNSEWLDKVAIAGLKNCLQNKDGGGAYDLPKILEVCSRELLRAFYPSIIKSRQTSIIEQCAEALDDEEQLLKLARGYFGWFGRTHYGVDKAFKIWKRLGYKNGLKKIQRWAKRDLKSRAKEYYDVCRALGDETGKQEFLNKFFSGLLGITYMYGLEDGLREDKDGRNLSRLAQHYFMYNELSRALALFVSIGDKEWILRVLDRAIVEESCPNIGGLWETEDRDILARLKQLAIRRAQVGDAKMYAEKLNEPLTKEDYADIFAAERKSKGYVNEETAREAGVVLQAEDYANKARCLLKAGDSYGADAALKKALELQKKDSTDK